MCRCVVRGYGPALASITAGTSSERDEFGGRSSGTVFGMVSAAMPMGVALGPSLVGVIRDGAGGDGSALRRLAALDALAVVMVLWRRARPRRGAGREPAPALRPPRSR